MIVPKGVKVGYRRNISQTPHPAMRGFFMRGGSGHSACPSQTRGTPAPASGTHRDRRPRGMTRACGGGFLLAAAASAGVCSRSRDVNEHVPAAVSARGPESSACVSVVQIVRGIRAVSWQLFGHGCTAVASGRGRRLWAERVGAAGSRDLAQREGQAMPRSSVGTGGPGVPVVPSSAGRGGQEPAVLRCRPPHRRFRYPQQRSRSPVTPHSPKDASPKANRRSEQTTGASPALNCQSAQDSCWQST